jgi:hypothetical protein
MVLSATIFAAHAVDAYRAGSGGILPPAQTQESGGPLVCNGLKRSIASGDL